MRYAYGDERCKKEDVHTETGEDDCTYFPRLDIAKQNKSTRNSPTYLRQIHNNSRVHNVEHGDAEDENVQIVQRLAGEEKGPLVAILVGWAFVLVFVRYQFLPYLPWRSAKLPNASFVW